MGIVSKDSFEKNSFRVLQRKESKEDYCDQIVSFPKRL